MLEYMHIKNLALIKECEIQFGRGLNVLTGETGAGKSVLLGSINLALGAKADKDIIRTGEEEAYVELLFSTNDTVDKMLSDMELSNDEQSVCISRKITATKNVFKINGEIVPAKQVKELAGGLLDIHGQHEHQSLLSLNKQRDMLDAFGGEPIAKALQRTEASAKEYLELSEELESANKLSGGREREISLLSYECREIEEAELVIGEDESLEEEYKRMKSAEKLILLVNEALSLVSSDSEGDAGSLISRASGSMKRALMLDESLDHMTELLLDAEGALGDFALEASKYMDKLEFSNEDFVKTEERLNLINTLKSKFGDSIPKILAYYEEKSAELEKLNNLDEYLEKLKEKTVAAFAAYKKEALDLSSLRKEAAKEFSKLLEGELLNLNFNDARFSVAFDCDEDLVSPKGIDKPEFMVSTNIGEPVKPMKNVASGGELSRIMLAVKTILAKKDEVDALIFDEIDTGISGKTAWEVSGRLSKLSREHQVILITHLAQIAASADNHYVIEKSSNATNTVTTISELSEEGAVMELSRLLGSDSNDEATILNARELKKKATARKNEF